jgi:hypothetical protein
VLHKPTYFLSDTAQVRYAHRLLQAASIIILGIGFLKAAPAAPAAEVSSVTVGELYNWYYATTFGTGVYIVGEASVSVIAIPFSYT